MNFIQLVCAWGGGVVLLLFLASHFPQLVD